MIFWTQCDSNAGSLGSFELFPRLFCISALIPATGVALVAASPLEGLGAWDVNRTASVEGDFAPPVAKAK